MPTQRRSRRDAEDVLEAVGPTEVENFRAAIMTVGAQQDFRSRPAGADRAQQTAQKRFDLLAAWSLGGTKHGGDEAAMAGVASLKSRESASTTRFYARSAV